MRMSVHTMVSMQSDFVKNSLTKECNQGGPGFVRGCNTPRLTRPKQGFLRDPRSEPLAIRSLIRKATELNVESVNQLGPVTDYLVHTPFG